MTEFISTTFMLADHFNESLSNAIFGDFKKKKKKKKAVRSVFMILTLPIMIVLTLLFFVGYIILVMIESLLV